MFHTYTKSVAITAMEMSNIKVTTTMAQNGTNWRAEDIDFSQNTTWFVMVYLFCTVA